MGPQRANLRAMWTFMRPFVAICLAVILAATSLTMAVARGQTRIAGELVLCTGYGISTVTVDANGEPTGPVHICPDMVLGLMAALDMAAPILSRPEGVAAAMFDADLVALRAHAVPPSRARDPPSLV